MRAAFLAAGLIAAASWACAHAFAQGLHDPTEPPSGGQFASSVAPGAAGATLQSVIVSEGRKLALIDGRMYRAGDKVGEDTVAAISANEVTLRGPEGVKVLKLYASMKKPAAGAQGRTGPAAGKGAP